MWMFTYDRAMISENKGFTHENQMRFYLSVTLLAFNIRKPSSNS